MSEIKLMNGLLLDETIVFSFAEACHHCQLSEALLKDWLSHGLLGENTISSFDHKMIARIRAAERMHTELEINVQGVILVLELLEEMAKLQNELTIYKRLG